MSVETDTQDRRKFLRQLGKTTLIGLGVAFVPVGRAMAGLNAPTYCCPDTGGHCSGGCFPGATLMYCASINCCFCESRLGGCRNYSLPPC